MFFALPPAGSCVFITCNYREPRAGCGVGVGGGIRPARLLMMLKPSLQQLPGCWWGDNCTSQCGSGIVVAGMGGGGGGAERVT